jgi:hypothetical protein
VKYLMKAFSTSDHFRCTKVTTGKKTPADIRCTSPFPDYLRLATVMLTLVLCCIEINSASASLLARHPYSGLDATQRAELYYSADRGYVGPDIPRNWDVINERDRRTEKCAEELLKVAFGRSYQADFSWCFKK